LQKKHHEKRSYGAEFEELLALHGLEEG
jgi:hypothetical protein